MKNKLNCVEMKYQSAEKIHEQLKDYNLGEELNFWKIRSENLKNEKMNLKNKESQVLQV